MSGIRCQNVWMSGIRCQNVWMSGIELSECMDIRYCVHNAYASTHKTRIVRIETKHFFTFLFLFFTWDRRVRILRLTARTPCCFILFFALKLFANFIECAGNTRLKRQFWETDALVSQFGLSVRR